MGLFVKKPKFYLLKGLTLSSLMVGGAYFYLGNELKNNIFSNINNLSNEVENLIFFRNSTKIPQISDYMGSNSTIGIRYIVNNKTLYVGFCSKDFQNRYLYDYDSQILNFYSKNGKKSINLDSILSLLRNNSDYDFNQEMEILKPFEKLLKQISQDFKNEKMRETESFCKIN